MNEFNLKKRNLISKKNNITSSLENLSQIDDLTKIKILKLSKINKNPIFLDDIILKNKILNTIKKNYPFQNNNSKKNILSMLLNYNLELILTNTSINNVVNNKNSNLENNNLNESILTEILKDNHYVDIVDFYISHFINIKLNIDSIIDKIEFVNHIEDNANNSNISIEHIEIFENKFKKLLRSLSEEELILFNLCISGSSIEQPKYEVNLYSATTEIIYPIYHSCFSRMDIINIRLFRSRYLDFSLNSNVKEECKRNFVDSLNLTLSVGFNMA